MLLSSPKSVLTFEEATDDDLMRAVSTHDAGAFTELAKRHLRRIVNLAARMLGSRADAEEVAQEAFARVWSCAMRWRTADNGGSAFRAWLHRIVVNLVADRKRKRVMLPIEEAKEPIDEFDNGFAHVYGCQLSDLVSSAISRLPARQQTATVLCVLEGRSYIEAGKLMSLTVGAVESLLVRARRALRKDLDTAYRELLSR